MAAGVLARRARRPAARRHLAGSITQTARMRATSGRRLRLEMSARRPLTCVLLYGSSGSPKCRKRWEADEVLSRPASFSPSSGSRRSHRRNLKAMCQAPLGGLASSDLLCLHPLHRHRRCPASTYRSSSLPDRRPTVAAAKHPPGNRPYSKRPLRLLLKPAVPRHLFLPACLTSYFLRRRRQERVEAGKTSASAVAPVPARRHHHPCRHTLSMARHRPSSPLSTCHPILSHLPPRRRLCAQHPSQLRMPEPCTLGPTTTRRPRPRICPDRGSRPACVERLSNGVPARSAHAPQIFMLAGGPLRSPLWNLGPSLD